MFKEYKLGEIIGCTTKWYTEIDSTNNLAHQEITQSAKNGTVIIADNQTKGRGQRTNTWESEAGKNLTFSLIIYPHFMRAEEQFLLSKAISTAVVDLLADFGLSAKIKWPNDIYVGNKKIAGILIENTLSGSNIAASIIGVGLNVNQKIFLSDAPNPTSAAIELGYELNREDALKRLLFLFEQKYKSLATREFEQLESHYFSELYRSSGFYPYKSKNEQFQAKIVGILNSGELLLEKEDKTRQSFAFKEIEFIL